MLKLFIQIRPRVNSIARRLATQAAPRPVYLDAQVFL
jgi:hypothetical protein